VCLIGVYLTGVHLISVYLKNVCLTGVHLMGVHLTGVHLIGVYLMGVYLIDVYFRFSKIVVVLEIFDVALTSLLPAVTPVYRILHHTLIKHREMMISIS
jgi:hypothetical protein